MQLRVNHQEQTCFCVAHTLVISVDREDKSPIINLVIGETPETILLVLLSV
jgi:hypothetical protein